MAGNNDLNKLKQTLENLSDEAMWRAKRGEAIEDVVLEEAPTIEREEIVRKADLNRDDLMPAEKEEVSQMDDKNAQEISDITNLGDDLANLEDPGIENLQEDDFSFDDVELPADLLEDEINISPDDEQISGALDEEAEDVPTDSIEMQDTDSLTETSEESWNEDAPMMDLPDMDKPLNVFGDSEDEQALFAMGEADEMNDIVEEMDENAQIHDTPAIDLLMEDDLSDLHNSAEQTEDDDDDIEAMDSDFNLGDLGNFGNEKEELAPESKEDEAFEEDVDDEGIEQDDLIFSEEKIEKINDALAKLPRNLRLALQKILASEETEADVIYRLTQKLLKRSSARSLANEVRAITGQTIILPSRYQQNAGEEFEKRRTGFSYNFKQFAWPILRPLMVSIVMLAILIFVVFTWVYRPWTASVYYRRGYEYIRENNYNEALLNFSVAHDGWRLGPISVLGWPVQRWFFDYAEAFAGQRQYTLAQEMYDRLLFAYPTARRAYLEYGDFEGRRRANFERADQIYAQYLNDVNSKDVVMLMARSENLLRWGANDPSRLKQARDVYATLIATDGLSDRTVMGLLEFSVLLDDREEIEMWSQFILARPKMTLDAEIVALTAGWFISHGRAHDAEQLLQKAIELEDQNPIIHYELARFYEEIGDLFSARNSLDQATKLIANQEPMTLRDTEIFVDIFRRSAALRFQENILDAKAQYELERAIAYYENGVERRILGRNAFHGGMYKELADVFYVRDRAFKLADVNYAKALENSFDDADLRYKRGFIAYNDARIGEAINEFSLSHDKNPTFKNTVYSLATVLSSDGRYASAEAFYQTLRRQLEMEKIALAGNDDPSMETLRRENAEYLMKVYNNLGVVLHQLSLQRSNRSELQQQAQVSFQQAMFLWDALTRDPQTRARVVSQDLPGMNFRGLLHPTAESQLYLYDALPMFIDNPPVSWGF